MLDNRRKKHHRRALLVALCALSIATTMPGLADVLPSTQYAQRLESARSDYFAGIDGDGSATDRAEQAFGLAGTRPS